MLHYFVYSVVETSEMESELEMMEAQEDLKEQQLKYQELTENLNKLTIFCRNKVCFNFLPYVEIIINALLLSLGRRRIKTENNA